MRPKDFWWLLETLGPQARETDLTGDDILELRQMIEAENGRPRS
jgi:hypothetical protein